MLKLRLAYLFLNDDTDLLNSSIELFEVNFTLVVDVKELETLC